MLQRHSENAHGLHLTPAARFSEWVTFRLMPPTSKGATIRIFLVDGTPQGLRLVERPGWTGLCLAFARADYTEARARPEFASAGVYVLVGPDPEGKKSRRVYVGETDEIRVRLDAHQKEKDFWTHGYLLSTKDNSLNKAHVRYLEARLIELARMADNATLDNGTQPPPTGLSEPETADMERYLEYARIIFPLVDVNVFEPVDRLSSMSAPTTPPVADGETGTILYLKTPMTEANGEEDSRGFLVHEGALARRDIKHMAPYYERLRARLIEEGVLVDSGKSQLRLAKSYIFESPSAAASVLCGGSKNGRTEWKDGAGHTLKEIQTATTSGPK